MLSFNYLLRISPINKIVFFAITYSVAFLLFRNGDSKIQEMLISSKAERVAPAKTNAAATTATIGAIVLTNDYSSSSPTVLVDPLPEKTVTDNINLVKNKVAFNKPLVSHIYTADPAAHVFDDGKIYVYTSHDYESNIPADEYGTQFDMQDYHVLSISNINNDGKITVTDHGVILDIKDVPWATKQMWAPDAIKKMNKYYLYFPAKDKTGKFRIGVAISDNPTGPFKPEANPINGSYSIDPAIFRDGDGSYYMYLGGLNGGQLQHWNDTTNEYNKISSQQQENHVRPRIAKMADNMLEFAEPLRNIKILLEDEATEKIKKEIRFSDKDHMFFEASWLHKHNGKYYFSYSTGHTHYIQYAIGDSPYGPFVYKGKILEPVVGWTTHHSIVQASDDGQWYLFYHDSSLSKGLTHLRCVKMTKLVHNDDGSIETITPV